MSTRWQKTIRRTKCNEADARCVALALQNIDIFKSLASTMSPAVRDYMNDKLADAIIEITEMP